MVKVQNNSLVTQQRYYKQLEIIKDLKTIGINSWNFNIFILVYKMIDTVLFRNFSFLYPYILPGAMHYRPSCYSVVIATPTL